MLIGYIYELWNGKVIGEVVSNHVYPGKSISIPTISAFKEHYDKKYEVIAVPIKILKTYDDGITVTFRKVLDVRKKSKRQIKLILEYFGKI